MTDQKPVTEAEARRLLAEHVAAHPKCKLIEDDRRWAERYTELYLLVDSFQPYVPDFYWQEGR
jgi:hypothetical protein